MAFSKVKIIMGQCGRKSKLRDYLYEKSPILNFKEICPTVYALRLGHGQIGPSIIFFNDLQYEVLSKSIELRDNNK
jgi:hypothetical protein